MIRPLAAALALTLALATPVLANEHLLANDHHVTLAFKDKAMHTVLEAIAKEGGVKLVCDEKLDELVTVEFKDEDLEEVFEHFLTEHQIHLEHKGKELHATRVHTKTH